MARINRQEAYRLLYHGAEFCDDVRLDLDLGWERRPLFMDRLDAAIAELTKARDLLTGRRSPRKAVR